MINLLPPEIKSGYRYAQRNVALRRWVGMSILAVLGLTAIIFFGLFRIQDTTSHYQHQNDSTEALFKQEKYEETQKRVKDIGSSFKLAAQVLGNEVLFSKLLTQIGVITPANTNLTALSINKSQSALDLTANTADYASATQFQVNLADATNKIFSKADIISINCDNTADSGDSKKAYPCDVSIRALFAPDNPFLLVNSKGTTK